MLTERQDLDVRWFVDEAVKQFHNIIFEGSFKHLKNNNNAEFSFIGHRKIFCDIFEHINRYGRITSNDDLTKRLCKSIIQWVAIDIEYRRISNDHPNLQLLQKIIEGSKIKDYYTNDIMRASQIFIKPINQDILTHTKQKIINKTTEVKNNTRIYSTELPNRTGDTQMAISLSTKSHPLDRLNEEETMSSKPNVYFENAAMLNGSRAE